MDVQVAQASWVSGFHPLSALADHRAPNLQTCLDLDTWSACFLALEELFGYHHEVGPFFSRTLVYRSTHWDSGVLVVIDT